MAIERQYFLGDFQYRARCPACTWDGSWRSTKGLARAELSRHKGAGHHPEELVEPGDHAERCKLLSWEARNEQNRARQAVEALLVARSRLKRLEARLGRAKRVLDPLGMAYVLDG